MKYNAPLDVVCVLTENDTVTGACSEVFVSCMDIAEQREIEGALAHVDSFHFKDQFKLSVSVPVGFTGEVWLQKLILHLSENDLNMGIADVRNARFCLMYCLLKLIKYPSYFLPQLGCGWSRWP